MPRRRRKSKRRNWILIAVAALLLIGIAGGAYYVLKVARARTDPFKQAMAARRAGEDAKAESLCRSMLEADATELRARVLLVQILTGEDRLDEAKETAEFWLQDPETEAYAFRALSQIALRENDRTSALKYARMAADRDPGFAQSMILHIQDAMGTPADRERSVRAAEALATLAQAPEAAAGARLYAAETLRDIQRLLPSGARRDALRAREELNRSKASEALLQSSGWKERLPAAKAMMARIDILSDESNTQQDAAEKLDSYLKENGEASLERYALVRYLVADGRAFSAMPHVKALRGANSLLFLRAVSLLASTPQRADAIKLVEEDESLPAEMASLVVARLLMAGEEAERRRAVAAYEQLAADSRENWTIVREAYQQIRASGEAERALRVLDTVGAGNEKARFGALLEHAALAVERGLDDESDTLLGKLAEQAVGRDLIVAFERLRGIPEHGAAASVSFLDKVLERGGEAAAEVCLLRAAVSMRRPGSDASGTPWSEVARRDLETIAQYADPGRKLLVDAATLAAISENPHLTGVLLGRALVNPGDKGDPLQLLGRIGGLADDGDRAAAARGLLEAATMERRHEAWVQAIAGAVERGDLQGLRVSASAWSRSESAPQPMDALLQFGLAARAGDLEEAELYARAIHEGWPERPGGLELLANVLLRAEKYSEVLDLHSGDDLTPSQRAQRIDALRGLKRRDDAIAEARLLVREMEGNDLALLVLSRLLAEVDPDAAFAAISPVTGHVGVDLFRADLLLGRGEEDSAARIYEDLLAMSGDRNIMAWRGLAQVRSAQGREGEFELRISPIVESPPEGMNSQDHAQLTLLRAQSREALASYGRALDDYQKVLAVLPNNVTALNNAAWIISMHMRWTASEEEQQREIALSLVDRALIQAPGVAPLLHTRARIHERMGRAEQAFADFDAAIRALQNQLDGTEETEANRDALLAVALRRARYRLDKADLLARLGGLERKQEAHAIRTEIQERYPRTAEGRRAALAIEKEGD